MTWLGKAACASAIALASDDSSSQARWERSTLCGRCARCTLGHRWRRGSFRPRRGGLLDPHNVRRACRRVLKLAQLPPHFTPHSLRHTYASILISEGKPIPYVQAQLGHASITLTVDTYGK